MTTLPAHRLRELVTDAYYEEAARLDAHDIAGWLPWITEDFRYEVPIPVSVAGAPTTTHSSTGLLATETADTMKLWAARVAPDLTDSAYAENPPPRTRHFVTNIRVTNIRVNGDADTTFAVTSNVLMTWCHWNDDAPRILSGERHDTLLYASDCLRLAYRRVLVDVNVVHLNHLRVIL